MYSKYLRYNIYYQEVFFIYGFFYIRNMLLYYLCGPRGRAKYFFICCQLVGPRPTLKRSGPTLPLPLQSEIAFFRPKSFLFTVFFISDWLACMPEHFFKTISVDRWARPEFFLHTATGPNQNILKKLAQTQFRTYRAELFLIYFYSTSVKLPDRKKSSQIVTLFN